MKCMRLSLLVCWISSLLMKSTIGVDDEEEGNVEVRRDPPPLYPTSDSAETSQQQASSSSSESKTKDPPEERHAKVKEESSSSSSASEDSNKSSDQPYKREKIRLQEVIEDKFDASNRNWGSYYDPKNIFCGKYDCYKILGFDYDSFGKNPPDTKVITKRYRKLSREWHPDKSKHRDAKERFVKIARAYEVLTDVELRKEYDFMRFNQEAYFAKYGTSVLWNYAPKSDVTFVIFFIFIIANVFSWYSQLHRWNLVANRLIQAAVEDWTTAQGGSPESRQLREQALAILHENEADNNTASAPATPTTDNKKATKKTKGTKKVVGREKKKMEEEALWPVVKALVHEIQDFGGGFHKPTWKDLFVVSMAQAPFHFFNAALWNAKYYVRRWQKMELSEDERTVLTQRAVGPVVWDTKSEEERKEMIQRKLWILANKKEWDEEQEIRKLSMSEQKQYFKMKKKGKLE